MKKLIATTVLTLVLATASVSFAGVIIPMGGRLLPQPQQQHFSFPLGNHIILPQQQHFSFPLGNHIILPQQQLKLLPMGSFFR